MAKHLAIYGLATILTLSPLGAHAQVAPGPIPSVVQINDPKGDANFLNDQDNAYGTPAAGQGDYVGPADASTATDLMKVWFSHTPEEVSLSFQTEAAPIDLAGDFYYRFSTNPGAGSVAEDTTRGCLQWTLTLNGAGGGWTGPDVAELTDKCNDGAPVIGKFGIGELPDGTGITTMTFPRGASGFFVDGGVISKPFGVSRYLVVGPTGAPSPAPPAATAITSDTTKRGADYMLAPPVPPKVSHNPPGPPEGKPEKKGCKKNPDKGKKKGCNKPRSSRQAPLYGIEVL